MHYEMLINIDLLNFLKVLPIRTFRAHWTRRKASACAPNRRRWRWRRRYRLYHRRPRRGARCSTPWPSWRTGSRRWPTCSANCTKSRPIWTRWPTRWASWPETCSVRAAAAAAAAPSPIGGRVGNSWAASAAAAATVGGTSWVPVPCTAAARHSRPAALSPRAVRRPSPRTKWPTLSTVSWRRSANARWRAAKDVTTFRSSFKQKHWKKKNEKKKNRKK